MQIKSSEEMMENIKRYTLELQELQLQKKAIDDDIKKLKADYKEEGVPVSVVGKALAELKKKAKLSDNDMLELDIIQEKLAADETVMVNIQSMLGK